MAKKASKLMTCCNGLRILVTGVGVKCLHPLPIVREPVKHCLGDVNAPPIIALDSISMSAFYEIPEFRPPQCVHAERDKFPRTDEGVSPKVAKRLFKIFLPSGMFDN